MIACTGLDWFDPATLPSSPVSDAWLPAVTCARTGTTVCVSCELARIMNQTAPLFRLPEGSRHALVAAGKTFALFMETASHFWQNSGFETSRVDHVRLAADGTVRPSTLVVPADWCGKSASKDYDDCRNMSVVNAAASNGDVAAVSWREHFCINPDVYFTRFDASGKNLLGAPVSQIHVSKANITGLCRPSVDLCGSAFESSLVYTEAGKYGLAYGLDESKAMCESAQCRAGPGCTYHENTQIYVSVIQPDPWKDPTKLHVVNTSERASLPSIAWSGKEFGVAWVDERHGDPEIYFARVKADGSGLVGKEQRVSNAPFESTLPVLVWNGASYGLAWQDSRRQYANIYFVRIDEQGRPDAAGPRAVAGTPAGAWAPTMAWDGKRFGLAWEDARGGHPEVFFKLLDTAGKPLSAEVRVSDAARQATKTPKAYMPRLVYGPAGEFAISWVGTRSHIDAQDKTQVGKEYYFARVQCD